MDTTHTSNALKCVQTSSATSTQTSTVFEAGSKSLSRTTTKKINPLGLDAFDTDAAALQIQMRHGSIDLQHLSHLLAKCKCARHLFDFGQDLHFAALRRGRNGQRLAAPRLHGGNVHASVSEILSREVQLRNAGLVQDSCQRLAVQSRFDGMT